MIDLQPAHSLLGASSAERWLHCPGSFALSQKVTHRPTSIYAATGTLAHEYIERAEKTGFVPLDPDKEIGRTWDRDGHVIVVDEEFVDGVNVMLDYLYEAVTRTEWLVIEERVNLDRLLRKPPPVPVFGTLDAAGFEIGTRTLEIADYKNGAGVFVSPVENPQLMFYAAGMWGAHPALNVRRIRLTIVQPNASRAHPIRSWEISPVDLLMWVDDVLVPGIEAVTQPDAPLVMGPWCRFCPVAHDCPLLHQQAVALAQREFDDLPTDNYQLAQLLDEVERAEIWTEAVREFALDYLKRQHPIPGWELVPTRPTRKWTQDDIAITNELLNVGVDMGAIIETRVRSPAQLEKQLSRSLAGQLIWAEHIGPTTLIESRSSGVKLARKSIPIENFEEV